MDWQGSFRDEPISCWETTALQGGEGCGAQGQHVSKPRHPQAALSGAFQLGLGNRGPQLDIGRRVHVLSTDPPVPPAVPAGEALRSLDTVPLAGSGPAELFRPRAGGQGLALPWSVVTSLRVPR